MHKKNVVEHIAESPAIALDAAMKISKRFARKVGKKKSVRKARVYWKLLGPGLVTGAADDDPSGIATYSQTGAQTGFTFLWLAPFSVPFMAVVQEMCARMGLVTGRGLAGNIRHYYSKKVLYVCTTLLFIANTLNIGADLGAMAKTVQLLAPYLPFTLVLIALTITGLGLQIFFPYERYARYLKWLTFSLLSYVAASFVLPNLKWSEIGYHALVPSFHFSREYIILVCAILGTTISPYLFFWQTAQEVEEEILSGRKNVPSRQGATHLEIKRMRVDVWSGMIFSNIVMFFIIMTAGATLFPAGITTINSASDAAQALRPLAGNFAYLLFALGLFGTGMLAVPILAGSTSYAISESFGWKYGLYRKLKQAHAFYGVIILATAVGFLINFIGINPIRALIYTAVANGLIAPVMLVLIVRLSSNTTVMGEHANGKLTSTLGWIITGIMTIAGIATIYTLFM